MKQLSDLVRKNILELKPYSSARDEYPARSEATYMDANENPYNYPYNRYPDPLQIDLKVKIAAIKKIAPGMLFLGNGSDEAIDLLIRIFCEPRTDNLIIINPTYGMYKVCADVNDVETRFVSLSGDFQPDVPAIISAADNHSKLLFLCSPNNPTANSIRREIILDCLNRFQGIVVLDEAYIDFSASPGFVGELEKHPNLVILQTFSKAWGMAGIRLGMAMAAQPIIDLMNKVKYPYNVSFITQKIASQSLDNLKRKEKWVNRILDERTRLMDALRNLSFTQKVYPSDANFFLVRVNNPRSVYDALVREGIIIRDRSNVHMIEGCLRITVGTHQENSQLLKTLKKISLTDTLKK